MVFRASALAATILLAASVALPAQQEIYYYVDEEGVINFTDMPRAGATAILIGGSRPGADFTLLDSDTPFSGILNDAGVRYGLDPALLAAVARAESDFNPRAVSHAGAKGVMQLMDATATDYGVEDVFDPAQNIDAGSRHIRDLLLAYGGDLRLALAAYNAGREAVRRHGGVPPYEETRTYLRRIAATYGNLDTEVSSDGIDSSYAAARAIARGQRMIYRYHLDGRAVYSDSPPIGFRFEEVSLRR